MAIGMSFPARTPRSMRWPARPPCLKAGSPTSNRNEKTPARATADVKWIQRITMSEAFTSEATPSL